MGGGIGDSIYARGMANRMPDAYVRTAWPEIFPEHRCVPFESGLRSIVRENSRRRPRFVERPEVAVLKYACYESRDLDAGVSIPAQMAERCGVADPVFDLPDFGPSSVASNRVAVVRPVTLRREWLVESRAPDPTYIAQAAQALHEAGFTVVSVADVNVADEWMLEPAPYADVRFEHGELLVTEMLALVQHAACAVGGIGWIVPACMAAGVPLLCVLGGFLQRNAPDRLTMGEHRITYAWPDDPCWCNDFHHDCRKTITDFGKTLENWIETL